MNLFLDINILIDLLTNRQPFAIWAYKIFSDQKKGKWKLYTSSNSILTSYYLLEKQIGAAKSKQAIKILISRLEIETIQKIDIQKALITEFKDFEDAVQHECASKIKKLNYIVTRNKKDFKNSIIPIISSEELYINEK